MLDTFERFNLTNDELQFAQAMRHFYRCDNSLYKDDNKNVENALDYEKVFWEDLPQLVDAVHQVELTDGKGCKISCAKAIEMIGFKEFLSGLSRSAFHASASRWRTYETLDKNYKKGDTTVMLGNRKLHITDDMHIISNEDGKVWITCDTVFFDCSKMFK